MEPKDTLHISNIFFHSSILWTIHETTHRTIYSMWAKSKTSSMLTTYWFCYIRLRTTDKNVYTKFLFRNVNHNECGRSIKLDFSLFSSIISSHSISIFIFISLYRCRQFIIRLLKFNSMLKIDPLKKNNKKSIHLSHTWYKFECIFIVRLLL